MKTRGNIVTERAGVNFVRGVVEGAGCLFKEINLQHDVGQDATIVLVVDGHVRPREIALQIKSGASYVSKDACHLPASAAHVHFWAEHDLLTIGVAFDRAEGTAWWIDLKAEAREFRRKNPKAGTTFNFPKGLWNRFDSRDFVLMLLPTLLGEAPNVSLERLCEWVMCDDLETHDIGVRAIRARHYREAKAWECLISAFKSRPIDRLTLDLPLGLAKLLGHDDLGYYSGEIPPEVRGPAVDEVLAFGGNEIAKLLSMLPEDVDFQRPSLGYSLLPIFGQRAESPTILLEIRNNDALDPIVRELAGYLFDWYQREPQWWRFWRRDNRRWNV